MSKREAFWAVIAAALLLLLISAFTPSPVTPATAVVRAAQPTPRPMPQFGWHQDINERFALKSNEVYSATFVMYAPEERVKLVLDASSPVAFEFGPSDPGQGRSCTSPAALHTEKICPVGNGEPEFQVVARIRDERTPLETAGKGLLGAWVRSKTLSEQAIASNKVNLAIFRWTCIANCSP